MGGIEQLKELMSINTCIEIDEIEKYFNQIAELLFGKFAIRKGNTLYLFKEVEFYFYNRNHRDIITHPRISNSLCWYVNNFGGIDLNFGSTIDTISNIGKRGKNTQKYILNSDACFGGILIRQLMSKENGDVLEGPWACAELFRCYDATGYDSDQPLIIEHNSGMVSYIRKPRINLLTAGQTVEKKVNYILGDYAEHPQAEELYRDFTSFKDRAYRYVRCDKLMHDEETNVVYFSPLLKSSHPVFYQRLKDLLENIGIEHRELKYTKDYWARDYMPFQLGKDEFLKYRYYPDYLVNSKDVNDREYITNCTKVLRGMGISCNSTDLIIDGGNMVTCGPYIVMTDKVYVENHCKKDDTEFKARLESEIGHPVIIIPWTMHGDFDAEDTDKYGHSDGFIKWCGDNRILMCNHGDEYPEEATAIRNELEKYGFEVTEMRFNNKVCSPKKELNWAYINFLQVGKHIIMPIFNIEEDSIAYNYIADAFPDCTIHQIEMAEIAEEGGALHCISWNILSE